MNNIFLIILVFAVSTFFSSGYIFAENIDDIDNYSFDENEIEKKFFSFGGYIELFPSLYATDNDSALFLLKYHNNNPGDPYSDAYLNIQPEANIEKGIFRAFLRANAGAVYANDEWPYDFSLYEGYITLMPNQNIIIDTANI